MDLSSNLPKWLTPLNLPTLSGNLHQIAPAQIQDCNLVQIPPSEIAPISTELHQTALNCTDLASKSFLHRRKHPFPMTIGHQGGSSQIKVSPFFEPGRPASMLRCDAWGYAWNDQIPHVYRVCYAVTLVNPLLRGEGFLRVASPLFVFRVFHKTHPDLALPDSVSVRISVPEY